MYPADYTTLTTVRETKGIGSGKTGDDAEIRKFIRQASRLIDLWTSRHFMPYVYTAKFGPDYLRNSYDLRLDRDLLEITTLTNGDGSSIASNLYNLRPDNVYPKRLIELVSTGGVSWSFTYRESRVQIAGLWGFHNNYPVAWGNSLDTVQDNPLLVGATTLNVAAASGSDDRGFTRFEVGDYLKIESEQLQITAISTNALTVLRGVNGTTAAQHAQTTPIYVYRQMDDVRFMANEVVKWLYDHRETVNVGVQLAEGVGVVILRELPDVRELAQYYQPVVPVWGV